MVKHISNYVLSKKERFFDARNIAVAHVEDDDLGRAFGVKAFHRDQLKEFIKKHLISLTESDHEDKDKSDEDSSTCEGCVNCNSNDNDMDENYYQSEQEIASSEEEERPPQV